MDAGTQQCGKAAWEESVCNSSDSACADRQYRLSDCGLCYECDDYISQQTPQGQKAACLYEACTADAGYYGIAVYGRDFDIPCGGRRRIQASDL